MVQRHMARVVVGDSVGGPNPRQAFRGGKSFQSPALMWEGRAFEPETAAVCVVFALYASAVYNLGGGGGLA